MYLLTHAASIDLYINYIQETETASLICTWNAAFKTLHFIYLKKKVNHITLSSKLAIILCVTPHESAARAAPRRGM